MTNPYRIPEPFVASFSGGRTSGYMLRKILDAYDGRMPDRGKVIFCNTGKEREETLRFVERCSQRWGVDVTWVEYWPTDDGSHGTRIVDFGSASRKGEPLDAIIEYFRQHRDSKGEPPVLPNPVQRFCTAEGKLRASHRYVSGVLGWAEYRDAIGLRFDEPKRVAKMLRANRETETLTLFGTIKETIRGNSLPRGEIPLCPLSDDRITVDDIYDFWRVQDFDLELRSDEGNCDLCHLKSLKKILRLIRERPESADWWIAHEEKSGARFRDDRPSYAELKQIALGKTSGPGWLWADEQNGSCGEIDDCRCTD